MSPRIATLAALALLAACATAPAAVSKEPFPGGGPPAASPPATSPASPPAARPASKPETAAAAPAPTSVGTPDAAEVSNPKAYAARFPRPDLCEQGARSSLGVSRDRGWEVLRACVDRGGFTLIRRLLDGTWDKELQSKSDAAAVITKVIAARGGDVYGDLNLLRQKRVPIFGLAPATTHPELYQGRLVMARARVDDVKTEKGKVTVRLSEFALSGQLKDVAGSERFVTKRRGSYESRSSRDSLMGSPRRKSQGSYESEKSEGWEKTQRTENTPQETGLQAVARLRTADPFFEPGRQFVVLARFDGVRDLPSESEEEEAEKMAVLSVILYVEPSPIIVE
jgi:hypothetical protein